MEKLKNTAKKLDIVCRIMQICCIAGVIGALVGMLIVGSLFLFELAPELVATGYNTLDIGFLELELAEGVAPAPARILLNATVDMAMGAAMAVLAWLCIRCVRGILEPMKAGLPFHGAAASGMKKLALLTVIFGIVRNTANAVSLMLTMNCYHLPELLTGDRITGVQINMTFDLSFLVAAAVLLLLSYIFSYGAQLQKLSDETV